jgi:histone H3/H4
MNDLQAPSAETAFWKKCSSCKKPIPFESPYFVCSVSTCNTKKLGLAFCSVGCWDAHLGFANHRSADAVEERAPTASAFAEEQALTASSPDNQRPQRRIVTAQTTASGRTPDAIDTLVVVSKVKKFVKDASEFNTSQCCIDALTDKIVEICRQGIENARVAGRKTVMGRDIV